MKTNESEGMDGTVGKKIRNQRGTEGDRKKLKGN